MRAVGRPSSKGTIAAASSGAAAVALAMLAACGGEVDPRPSIPEPQVYAEPATLQFGRYSPCTPPAPLEVTIVNRGDVPIPLLGFSSSCRCVAANFRGQDSVPAGGTVEVLVDLSPWGQPGPHGHDLAIRVGDPASPQVLPVRIAYFMDPEVVPAKGSGSREANPTGRIRFEAVDGQPFRLLAVEPRLPIAIPRDAPAATVVEIEIPWSMLDAIASGEVVGDLTSEDAARVRELFRRREDGSWRAIWLTARTDHPVCPDVSVGLSNDVAGR
ncbi:MAG: DUF1573 domain-containing protein [Phycisphaerae bacterium]|nr:DUF1573 domain-containing protein [Phycisphaerae bacterium]